MPVFKFTFVNNSVVSCNEIPDNLFAGESRYEHYKGALIYVMVRALKQEDATSVAKKIADNFKPKK
jgi:hypothetical protein